MLNSSPHCSARKHGSEIGRGAELARRMRSMGSGRGVAVAGVAGAVFFFSWMWYN